MESGLMMTIEQLQKNLKSIDDRLKVNEVMETRIVYNNLHQPMQENKGDINIKIDGETLVALTKFYGEPSIVIDGVIIAMSVINDVQLALKTIGDFFAEWGNNDD